MPSKTKVESVEPVEMVVGAGSIIWAYVSLESVQWEISCSPGVATALQNMKDTNGTAYESLLQTMVEQSYNDSE